MADFKLNTEQINQLEQSGQITPQTAEMARQQVTPTPAAAALEPPMVPTGSPPWLPKLDPETAGKVANYVGASPVAAPVPEIPAQVPALPPEPGQSPFANTLSPVLAKPSPQTAEQMVAEGTITPETAVKVPGVRMPQAEQSLQFEPAPAVVNPTKDNSASRLKGMERGYSKIEQGIQKAAEAGAQQAAAEASYLETAQAEMEKMQADSVQREADRKAFLDKQMTEYQDLESKILNQKIDPNRFWNTRTTGQKIMGIIGLAFGGYVQGATGRGSPAQEMIGQAIQNDIAAQKAEMDKLKDLGTAKRNMFGLYMQQFGDERQAEAATRATMLQRVEMQMKQVAASFKAPQIQANAQKAIGEIQVQKNAALYQFEQAAQAKHVQLRGGSQLPAGLDIEQLPPEQRERYVPGLGLASTKEGAKDMREFKATADSINGGIQELISMTNSTGKSISPEQRARAETLASMLKGQLRLPIVGPGAVSESEWKLLDRIVANPATIFSLDAVSRASLETVNRRIQSQLADKARSNGLRPVNQQVSSFKPR